MSATTDMRNDPAGAAEQAARAARVLVRDLVDLHDLDAVCRLYDRIWRPDPQNHPVTTEVLRALTKAGNHIVGAFDGDELIGASVAFFGPPSTASMHSHIAGVSAAGRGRGVGFALKLRQRAWALEHGVSSISWTFDPLVRRNAYFNLHKLAATPAEYLPNFYGQMTDGINGDDDTDRLLVQWPLHAPPVVRACLGTQVAPPLPRADAAVGLSISEEGEPVPGPTDADTILIAIPPDIERLRAVAPDRARSWRKAVRETLGTLMNDGARAIGYDPSGQYVLTRREP
ncbi:GNAT family N-acetyltransferase [Streptomyces chartreusis]